MAKRTFKAKLSVDGIDGLIRQLEDYKDGLLSKNDLFVKRLAELGIPIIDQRIGQTIGDSDKSHYTHIVLNSFGDYSQAKLVVEGKDIAFIEFGAGIHFNGTSGTSPRPTKDGKENGVKFHLSGGNELKYTIGSYGDHHGRSNSWTYFSEFGEWKRSYGTKASMPLFNASLEIIRQAENIAREVFGNG
mgnify:CR=1 FL=1